RAALYRSGQAASVPRAVRVGGDAAVHRRLPLHHDRAAAPGVGAIRLLARARTHLLLRVRVPEESAQNSSVSLGGQPAPADGARVIVWVPHGIPDSKDGPRLDCGTRRARLEPQDYR